jgi:hypothetical protein
VLMLLWTLVSLADEPPDDRRPVKFGVTVDNADVNPKWRIVVYPWSSSNAEPRAELGEVDRRSTLWFGRSIDGTPAFWAVPAGDRLPGGDQALKRYFGGDGAAVMCKSDLRPVTESTNGRVVEAFHVDTISADGCRILSGPSEPQRQSKAIARSTCGCDTVTPSAAATLGTLMLLFAARSRRKSGVGRARDGGGER